MQTTGKYTVSNKSVLVDKQVPKEVEVGEVHDECAEDKIGAKGHLAL